MSSTKAFDPTASTQTEAMSKSYVNLNSSSESPVAIPWDFYK